MNRRAAISSSVSPSQAERALRARRLWSSPARPWVRFGRPRRRVTQERRRQRPRPWARRGAQTPRGRPSPRRPRPRRCDASSALASSKRARAASRQLLRGEPETVEPRTSERASGRPRRPSPPPRDPADRRRASGRRKWAITPSLSASASRAFPRRRASRTSTDRVRKSGRARSGRRSRPSAVAAGPRRPSPSLPREVERGQRVVTPAAPRTRRGAARPRSGPARCGLGELAAGGLIGAGGCRLHGLQSLASIRSAISSCRGDEHLRAAGVAEPEHATWLCEVSIPRPPAPTGRCVPVATSSHAAMPMQITSRPPPGWRPRHPSRPSGPRPPSPSRTRRRRWQPPRPSRTSAAASRSGSPNRARGLDGLDACRPSRLGGSDRSARVSESQPCSGTSPRLATAPRLCVHPALTARSRRRPASSRGRARAHCDGRPELTHGAVSNVGAFHVRDRALGVLESTQRSAKALLRRVRSFRRSAPLERRPRDAQSPTRALLPRRRADGRRRRSTCPNDAMKSEPEPHPYREGASCRNEGARVSSITDRRAATVGVTQVPNGATNVRLDFEPGDVVFVPQREGLKVSWARPRTGSSST